MVTMSGKRPLWRNKRVKTPTILQMEAVECGAAALAMILAHWGRWVPLEKLRIECGVSRDGSKAGNMLKAARRYGLEARGFRKEPASLRDLALPMILFWNFNHFVVLEGIKRGKVFLNDPGDGLKIISEEEFDQSFTGVVLTFKPEADFKKGGRKPSILRSLASRFTGSIPALCYAILAGLFLIIPGIVVPVFSKIFVDNILVAQMEGWIKPLFVAMGLTLLIRSGLTWLQEYYLLRQETRMSLVSSAQFFKHVFQLPIQFFSQRFPGEIGRRVQTNNAVAQILSRDLTSGVINLISIVFFAAIMFFYDAVLTSIGIGIAGLNLIVLRYVQNKQKILSQNQLQEQGKLISTTMSGLQMIETLKATGGESDFFSLWSGHYAKSLNAQQQLGSSTLFLTAVPPFLSGITNLSILVMGGFRVMDGHLTMGELVAFQSIMASFLNPVDMFVQLGNKLQQAHGDLNRLDDVLNYPVDERFKKPDPDDKTSINIINGGGGGGGGDDDDDDYRNRNKNDNKQESEYEKKKNNNETTNFDNETGQENFKKTKLFGDIEIRNLSFGYNLLEPPLFEKVNIHIKPGMRVAVVGRSGSGKSTIARVVAALYEPWEGEILFDGLPATKIPRALLNNSLSMVDQEIFLFEGTVKENISMWDTTIPNSQIVQAARDASIHDEISAKPGGYDGIVAESGWNFSGGQCQRLEIARALVGDPTILIMDEATSALDANTEKAVADSIRRRGCTCIIVAHRLSTIRDCDHIIVMDQGKIVQQGTHEDLIHEKGVYAGLIAME